jgi:hypothetical protein
MKGRERPKEQLVTHLLLLLLLLLLPTNMETLFIRFNFHPGSPSLLVQTNLFRSFKELFWPK